MPKTVQLHDGTVISSPGLGCMGMSFAYGATNDEQSKATLRKAIEIGNNFWNTANAYGRGHNEKIIGEVLREGNNREKVFLVSKWGYRFRGDDPAAWDSYLDGSAAHCADAFEQSVKDLGGIYPDAYLLHRVDPNTPIEESVRAMDALRQAGKIKHIGLSECSADTLRRAAAVAPISFVEVEYSPWTLVMENNGVLDACKELGGVASMETLNGNIKSTKGNAAPAPAGSNSEKEGKNVAAKSSTRTGATDGGTARAAATGYKIETRGRKAYTAAQNAAAEPLRRAKQDARNARKREERAAERAARELAQEQDRQEHEEQAENATGNTSRPYYTQQKLSLAAPTPAATSAAQSAAATNTPSSSSGNTSTSSTAPKPPPANTFPTYFPSSTFFPPPHPKQLLDHQSKPTLKPRYARQGPFAVPVGPEPVPRASAGPPASSDEDGQEEHADVISGAGLGQEDGDEDSAAPGGYEEEYEDEEDEVESVTAAGGPRRGELAPFVEELYLRHKAFIISTKVDGLDATLRPFNPSADPKQIGFGSPLLPESQPQTHFRRSAFPTPEMLAAPRFAFLDPIPLLTNNPRCPRCTSAELGSNGYSRPRRAADFDSTIYVFGRRYRCKNATCGSTFMSWDPRLLAQLPSSYRRSIPFIFGHRGAVTKNLFNTAYDALSSGVGHVKFADLVRRAHVRRYDEIKLLYWSAILSDVQSSPSSSTTPDYPPLPPLEDFGYSPGAKFFKARFIEYMRGLRPSVDQLTSLLPATILALDHSFKLPKHIAKVNGEPVMTTALTMTQQDGGIRALWLLPTKAQADYAPGLIGVVEANKRYGYPATKVMFTDNTRGDGPFLERLVPSLTKDIAPAIDTSPYSNLPLFETPKTILRLYTIQAVDDRLKEIQAAISPGSQAVVGLDAEWDVEQEEVGGRTIVKSVGAPAVVQIAWGDIIYIIQLARIRRISNRYPATLRQFLMNPQVLKLGVGVKADVTRVLSLYETFLSSPAAGVLDLVSLAKSLSLGKLEKESLDYLVARYLGRYLSKPSSIRLSTAWSQDDLPTDHLEYAARNAAASLQLYEALKTSSLDRHTPLPASLLSPSTPVSITSADGSTIIATGVVGYSGAAGLPMPAHLPSMLEGHRPRLTKKRTLIVINEILVPSVVPPLYSSYSRTGAITTLSTLESFGTPPFPLVVDDSTIRSFSAAERFEAGERNDGGRESNAVSAGGAAVQGGGTGGDEEAEDGERAGLGEALHAYEDEGVELGATRLFEPADHSETAALDEESLKNGRKILEPVVVALKKLAATPTSPQPFKRVIADAFHKLDSLPIPKRHAILPDFMAAFADSLFVIDPEDKALVSAHLEKEGKSFEGEYRFRRKWILQHVRRTIPPPRQLVPLLLSVFETYGPQKDAKTNLPLFSDATWHAAKRLLEDALEGSLSDPPDVQLYTVKRELPSGMRQYLCSRGTNFTEGGVHRDLRRKLGNSGVSLEMAEALLIDYRLRHNLLVVTPNRTGFLYTHHFDLPLVDELTHLAARLAHVLPPSPPVKSWICGSLYPPTTERFDILPITSTTAATYNIELASPSDLDLSSSSSSFGRSSSSPSTFLPANTCPQKRPCTSTPSRYAFLARKQGTRFAILHVHNKGEYFLFNQLTRTVGLNLSPTLRYAELARVWNTKAHGTSIFYKLPTHLQHYDAKKQRYSNIKISLQASEKARAALAKQVRSASRPATVPSPPTRLPSPQKVPIGPELLEVEMEEPVPALRKIHTEVSSPSPAAAARRDNPGSSYPPSSSSSLSLPAPAASSPVTTSSSSTCTAQAATKAGGKKVKMCKELGVVMIAYSPLGRGFLTGRYKTVADFQKEGDFRAYMPRTSAETFDKNYRIVVEFEKLASKKGCTPSQLVLAWVMAQADNIVPIPGTRSEKYLLENFSSRDITLTADEIAEIRRVCVEFAPEGKRYADEHDTTEEFK
ncbi:hypothetical protein JCM8097_006586 [Rhodosporidiobolus ruineniae]